jgi:hypothetical protein
MGKYSDALKSIEKCRETGRNAKNYEYFVPQVNRLENQIKSEM